VTLRLTHKEVRTPNILNTPPPAPPVGVPPLSEEAVGKAMTLRQKLEEHRKNQTCALRQARMDPLGFGLENFEAIGRCRTHDGEVSIDSSPAERPQLWPIRSEWINPAGVSGRQPP
jgi:hypothetical protein